MKKLWAQKADLRDYLPWWVPLNDEREIILTNSGGLLRVAQLELPDFETASPDALVAHHFRLTDAFQRFGNGWSMWLDQWRVRAPGYLPECDFNGNAAARIIDDSRRRQFTNVARPVFANTAFLAVHYLPQQRDALLGILMEQESSQILAHIAFFRENTDGLFQQLAHTLHGIKQLGGDELASYLAASATFEPKKTFMPTGMIAANLATRDWHTTPALKIGDRHIRTIEVRNFGSPSPLTVDFLHELPFEARWCVGFHGLHPDSQRKELQEVRKRWAVKQKGFGALLTEIVTKNPFAGRTDPEADRALATLDAMAGQLVENPFALAHMNVHVWSNDPEEAQSRASEVASKLNATGLSAKVATLNCTYAALGDMPGNVLDEFSNIRRSREQVAAITRVAPVTGVSTGDREDWRFNGPALFVGTTRRGVPLYFSLNGAGSDAAHTAVIGKTGSGKSVLLALMAAQFQRYKDARVIVFDRKRSFKVPCLAMGGDWIELGSGSKGVQPLRAIDRPEEFAWAHGWVLWALKSLGMVIQPHTNHAVNQALSHVAELPPDQRTLTALHAHLSADAAARQTLSHFMAGEGPYGDLFDGVVDSYGEAPVMGIETEGIMQLKEAAGLVITAVFRAMRRDRLTGDAPKLVVIDEAWSLLQSDLFGGEIESWAREMRKLKAALVLATQSLEDLSEGSARVIFDQIGNRIYLPHAEAMRQQSRELYERVGLMEDQIRLLANASPKGEYLIQKETVTRLVSVRLEDDALSICGASSPMDHMRADALLAEGVRPGEEFTRRWLEESTATWSARCQLRLVA